MADRRRAAFETFLADDAALRQQVSVVADNMLAQWGTVSTAIREGKRRLGALLHLQDNPEGLTGDDLGTGPQHSSWDAFAGMQSSDDQKEQLNDIIVTFVVSIYTEERGTTGQRNQWAQLEEDCRRLQYLEDTQKFDALRRAVVSEVRQKLVGASPGARGVAAAAGAGAAAAGAPQAVAVAEANSYLTQLAGDLPLPTLYQKLQVMAMSKDKALEAQRFVSAIQKYKDLVEQWELYALKLKRDGRWLTGPAQLEAEHVRDFIRLTIDSALPGQISADWSNFGKPLKPSGNSPAEVWLMPPGT